MNKRKIILVLFCVLLILISQISVFSNLRIGGVAPNLFLLTISILIVECESLDFGILSAIIFGAVLDLIFYSRFGASSGLLFLFCLVSYYFKLKYVNNFGHLALLLTIIIMNSTFDILHLLLLGTSVISNIDHLLLSSFFAIIMGLIYILTFRTYGLWQKRDLKIDR